MLNNLDELQISDEDQEEMKKFLYQQRVSNRVMMLANVENPKAKKRKVIPENYESQDGYEKDLIDKLEKQNQKKVRFVYNDGQKRDFGKTLAIPEYQDKLVRTKDNKEFVYEGKRDFTPYNAPRKPKYQNHQYKRKLTSAGPSGGGPINIEPREKFNPTQTKSDVKMSYPQAYSRNYRSKGEDTRSLYDDPKLQRLRQTYTRRLLMKIDQDYEKVEGCNWNPLNSNDKVPSNYYMRQTFKERVGPQNLNEKLINSEYDAFKLFFCDKVYGDIIRATKEKYQQNFLQQVQAYCHGHTQVRPIYYEFQLHERELDAYFAVQLFFGIVRLSNMHDYWKQNRRQTSQNKDEFYLDRKRKNLINYQQADDNYSYFIQQKMATIMSLSRFNEIRYNLSLTGVEAKRKHPKDILYRVRDFITDMNEKFKKYYYPDEFLCIDEGMIPFGGKAKFKVYNPDKPTQWGIKEYLLCDAQKSYTLHIQIYHGQSTWDRELKQKMLLENEQDIQSRTMELVLSLLKNYESKGHKVIMDNYYTSWQLLRELKNRGIGALGTIRHNRTGLSKQDILKEHFQQIYQDSYKRYAFYINQTKDSILLYFQGTADKEVAMITNFLDHSCNEEHKFSISKRHYYVPNVKLPYIISQYNKYKGGVDRRNAYMVIFRSRFSCRKWWQAIFERFFETALYNSFQIFKQIHRVHLLYKRGLFRDFRVNLMRLLGDRYQEYKQKVKEGTEKESVKKSKLDPHTFIEGCETVECEQCGAQTKNFCQECTVIQSQVVGICTELQNIKCERFHVFKDFLIDKDQVVISRKFKYVPWDPNSVVDFYQEVGQLQKQRRKLKNERTQLITENFVKKTTVENLQNIVIMLRELQGKSTFTLEDRKKEQELKKLIQQQMALLKSHKLEVKKPPNDKLNLLVASDGSSYMTGSEDEGSDHEQRPTKKNEVKQDHRVQRSSQFMEISDEESGEKVKSENLFLARKIEELTLQAERIEKQKQEQGEDIQTPEADDYISYSSFDDDVSEDEEIKQFKKLQNNELRQKSFSKPNAQLIKSHKYENKIQRYYENDEVSNDNESEEQVQSTPQFEQISTAQQQVLNKKEQLSQFTKQLLEFEQKMLIFKNKHNPYFNKESEQNEFIELD